MPLGEKKRSVLCLMVPQFICMWFWAELLQHYPNAWLHCLRCVIFVPYALKWHSPAKLLSNEHVPTNTCTFSQAQQGCTSVFRHVWQKCDRLEHINHKLDYSKGGVRFLCNHDLSLLESVVAAVKSSCPQPLLSVRYVSYKLQFFLNILFKSTGT